MRKITTAALALCLASASLAAAQARPGPPPPPKVNVGDTAPDFTLRYFDGAQVQAVKLSDYRGKKNVVLAFYVFAFTGG